MKKRIHNLLFVTLLGIGPVACFGSEAQDALVSALASFEMLKLFGNTIETDQSGVGPAKDYPDHLRRDVRDFLDVLESEVADIVYYLSSERDALRDESAELYAAICRLLAEEKWMRSQMPVVVLALEFIRDTLAQGFDGDGEFLQIVAVDGSQSEAEAELREMISAIPGALRGRNLLVSLKSKSAYVNAFVEEVAHRLEQNNGEKNGVSYAAMYRMLLRLRDPDGRLMLLLFCKMADDSEATENE